MFLGKTILHFIIQACIESEDPAITALGFDSLSELCNADIIGQIKFCCFPPERWGGGVQHSLSFKLF